jgi:hypothetical protein
MVAGFLCRKTLLSSALSQVRAQISTHSDGNFGLGEDDVPDHRICVPELTDVKNPEARA